MPNSPSLIDKTILITGATDGIGKATARRLASAGARLILHGRNQEKLSRTISQIREETGNQHLFPVLADFACLEEVRAMARLVLADQGRLDVLINNAGIFNRHHLRGADGYELTFTVNYLAHFLLTNLLRPLLKTSAPARVINLSSIGHYLVHPSLRGLPDPKFYWGWVAYCRSKGYMVLFTRELAKRIRDDGVTVNCLHLGTITSTNLNPLSGFRLTDLAEGAEAVVNLAINPELEKVSGEYFNKTRPARPSIACQNERRQESLWNLSLALCHLPG